MNYLKKILIRYFWTILETFLLSFIFTLLYYFDFISSHLFSIFLLFSLLIPIFINSLLLGKRSPRQGYLEGMKFSSPIIIFLFSITILLSKFQWKIFFYYFLILFTSIIGSILGINCKKKTSS